MDLRTLSLLLLMTTPVGEVAHVQPPYIPPPSKPSKLSRNVPHYSRPSHRRRRSTVHNISQPRKKN